MIDLRYGAATDTGRRAINEDSWLASPPVFVVADGMGGHQAGEVASRIAVEEVGQLAGRPAVTSDEVEEALVRCRRRIAELSRAHPERAHAGTTLVGCFLATGTCGEPYWLVVNVGDSRAYRVGQAGMERISVDHSVVQELIDAGQITEAQATSHPERNVVTRVLGSPDAADPDYFLLSLESTRRVLLCSDGVCGALDDATIGAILEENDDPQQAALRMVAAALDAGSSDNATAVVVDVMGWPQQRDEYAARGNGPDPEPDREGDTMRRPRFSLLDHLDE